MDYSIFRNTGSFTRVASTTPVTLGTQFDAVFIGGGVWLKALRFNRPTTGVFGTIRGCVFDLTEGPEVPGTRVSVTFTSGSGSTGWQTVALSAPVRLAYNHSYVVAWNFPGGTGNGYPQRAAGPTSQQNTTTSDYWRIGYGVRGWKNGPLRMINQRGASEDKQCRFLAGANLVMPTQASAADHGLDVVVTDTDPTAPAAQSGPTWTLWGQNSPDRQVSVAAGPAVVGLEFTPQTEVWATKLRVYRPQGNPSTNLVPIVNDAMSPYGERVDGPGGSTTTEVSGPGVVVNQATGALYKVTGATTGEMIETSAVTFNPDTMIAPVVGYSYTAGLPGWTEVNLSAPVRLAPGQRYKIVAALPDGRPQVTGFFTGSGTGAQGVSVGPLAVPSSAAAMGGSAASITTGTSTLAFPTSSTAEHAYLDVTVTTENPNDPREPADPTRLFDKFTVPDSFDIGIGSRTVGLEFTPLTAATAYGLRYYCHQGITATTGRLWAVSLDPDADGNPTGYPVAGSEVTFASNASSGWQFAPFRHPLRLAAGQRYKIAVRFPAGYIRTLNFFADGQSGPAADGYTARGLLSVPNNTRAAAGKQGTYALAEGVMPVETFNGANPWVDISCDGDLTAMTNAGAAGTAAEPAGAYRLWGTAAPAAPGPVPVVSTSHTRDVGYEFMVERNASIHGVRFYRPATTLTGPVQSRLYAVADADHASEVVGADTTFALDTSSTGWMWAPYRAPIALVPGRRYKVVFHFPGGFPTTAGYYADGGAGTFTDVVAGPLRGFSTANATRAQQPTAIVGGTVSDAVAYPSAPATDHPWIDVTVTDGTASGAITTAEEPRGALRGFGVGDPAPGNITLGAGPVTVGHTFTVSASATATGLRVWRPDLRGRTSTGRLYRVDTATTVDGTTVTFPPPTATGWVYAPLPAGVPLAAGVPYRVAVHEPGLVTYTSSALAAPVVNGPVTVTAAHTADGPTPTYPQTASPHSYWVDATLTTGATAVPADTLTLFGSTPDATVSVRNDGQARSCGTTFGGDAASDTASFWVKAIRFWRPSTTVGGTITGRLYEVARNGSVPIPYSDVVFTLSGTGWQTAELPYPVPLSRVPWYRVAVHFPQASPYTPGYFTTGPGAQQRYGPQGTVLTPPSGYQGGDGVQGAVTSGAALTYPASASINSSTPVGECYWVDVVATTRAPDVSPPPAPRQPLTYSQWGQISNTSIQVGTTFQYAQIANNVQPGPRSVGVEFCIDSTAWFVAYRFPRLLPAQQALTVTARLYRVTGPTTGEPVAGSEATFSWSASFWQAAFLAKAIPLTVGQRYKAVFAFPDSTPVGGFTRPLTDALRGPLRVYADSNATAATAITALSAYSLTYPVESAALSNGTPVVDVAVAPTDPTATVPGVRSVFDNRRPPGMTVQAWGNTPEADGTYVAGLTHGMEFYATTGTCYLRGYRYWRNPYPMVTQVTAFALWRVTGTATGTYYPSYDTELDATTGTLVAGSQVTMPAWTNNPNQPEAYAEGWVTVPLPGPVALTQGQRYRVAAWFPNVPSGQVGVSEKQGDGARPVTHFYWGTGPGRAGHVDGPLVAPSAAAATGGQQGSFETRYDEPRYPSGFKRGNAAQYWIDVEVLDSAPKNVDGGVVTVVIPPLATDPRQGGLSARSFVLGGPSVQVSATATRHVATDPTAPTLDVQARGIGGRGLVRAELDVRATPGAPLALDGSAPGPKGVTDTVVHVQDTQLRNVAQRPKRVADTVTHEIAPTAEGRSSIPWRALEREPELFEFNPEAVEFRFIAQNIATRRFMHWDLPINNPVLTWNLSGPFELTGTLNPAYADYLDLGLDEWATFIHVELGGRIVATGILMPWAVKGEELTIDAVGITTYPHGIPYMDIYEKFFPDTMEVIRELWRHIESFPNGRMGIQLPAGYMGVPLFGDPVYDSYTGEFLGWKKWSLLWSNFTDCGGLIDSLAAATPFDYLEVHAWNSTKTDVLHGISFGYPRAGRRRPELRFAEGENVLEAIAISEPDDAYASDIILKGAGEGYTQIFAWVNDTIWDRLRRVAIITDEQVQSVEVAEGIAIADLIRRIYARGIESIVVEAFHPFAPFGSYNVGDDILIEGMIPWVGEFALWHRITAMSVQPESGLVTLQVARSESFRYGRPDPLLGLK